MTRSGAIKTVLFNVLIAIMVIVFYHPNFIGLSITGASTLEMTCAITFLPILILVLIIGNKKLMSTNSSNSDEENKDELISELAKYKTNQIFGNQILLAIQHMETFEERKGVFRNVLNNNFKDDDNYSSFTDLINNAEDSIENNCRIILNSVSTFNYSEYRNFNNYQNTYTDEILRKKKTQYEEYFNEVNNRINDNANLLVEFDNLIMEVTRINNSDSKNELNDLVDVVAAMKQLHFGGNDDITNLTHKYEGK